MILEDIMEYSVNRICEIVNSYYVEYLLIISFVIFFVKLKILRFNNLPDSNNLFGYIREFLK